MVLEKSDLFTAGGWWVRNLVSRSGGGVSLKQLDLVYVVKSQQKGRIWA